MAALAMRYRHSAVDDLVCHLVIGVRPIEIGQAVVCLVPVLMRALRPTGWGRANEGKQDKAMDVMVFSPALYCKGHSPVATARCAAF